jgi:CheY-like chemotaxis protein
MESTGTRRLCVLLVDDDLDTLMWLRRAVGRWGHHAMTADSGQAGLALAKAIQFDLIVCDIGLPDEDGCEVLEKIRNLYAVKAIALTGYGMSADLTRFREAGFDVFLLKPVELSALECAIEKIREDLRLSAIGEGEPLCRSR